MNQKRSRIRKRTILLRVLILSAAVPILSVIIVSHGILCVIAGPREPHDDDI